MCIRDRSTGVVRTSAMELPFMLDTKAIVLIVLFAQNCVSTLIRRYVLGVEKADVSYAETLMAAEVVKGAVACWYASSETHEGRTGVAHLISLINPKHSWQMMALALLYGVMNVLNFVAARRISASTFTVLVQLKILSTAIAGLVVMNRSYTPTQWRAVLLLVLSSVLVAAREAANAEAAETAGITYESDQIQHTFGVLAVLGEVCGSGFASVYFEKVVKARDTGLSIWARNVQLAFWSILIFMVMRFKEAATEPKPFLHGWSAMVVALVILGAMGGILVALTIKYADALAKTMAITGSIGVLALIDYMFMNEPMSMCNLIGVGCTMIGVLNYSFDTTVPPKSPVLGSTAESHELEKLVVAEEEDAKHES
eukprot:TRINITY_DN17123_c0_g1_i1.p1 TRINITY_DN17123_c0_g1~~TRINITY_DN17123_c0_g1_i1.p1  ORF type:complete len:370 (-),score=99.42 TRINITY_DN17123_c0_g1_i1:182-1291(-)